MRLLFAWLQRRLGTPAMNPLHAARDAATSRRGAAFGANLDFGTARLPRAASVVIAVHATKRRFTRHSRHDEWRA
jgi:hypothetical protein